MAPREKVMTEKISRVDCISLLLRGRFPGLQTGEGPGKGLGEEGSFICRCDSAFIYVELTFEVINDTITSSPGKGDCQENP